MTAPIRNIKETSTIKLLPKLQPVFQYSNHDRLVLPMTEGFEIIKFEDIVYCAADSNYVKIYTVAGRKITLAKTLKWVQARLNQLFVRSHQSYLINLLLVEKYNFRNSMLHLKGGVSVPVSRSMKKEISNYFNS